MKIGESAVVDAVEGEATLNALEAFGDLVVGVQERIRYDLRAFVDLFELAVPVLGFDAAHAAEEPVGMDEGVDGGLFAGADGAAGGLVFAGEVVEGFGDSPWMRRDSA